MESTKSKDNTYGILSFIFGILGFIIPLIGIVFSILAIVMYYVQKKKGKSTLATIGAILGVLSLALAAFMFLVFGLAIISTIDSISDSSNDNIDTNIEEPPTIKQKPTKTTYKIGDVVQVDDLTYMVTKAETFTTMGSTVFKKETNGKFIKVYFKVINNGKETKQIFTPRFELRDSLDRRYQRVTDDMLYIADALEFGKQLQPGLGTDGAIVFEVPKNSNELKLIISGDWLSMTEKEIELQQIRDIWEDTTQKKKEDAMFEDITGQSRQEYDDLMEQNLENLEDLQKTLGQLS